MDIKSKVERSLYINSAALSSDNLSTYRLSFDQKLSHRMAMNAVTNSNAVKVALNREVVSQLPNRFSIEIESGDITHQKMSGRCWMFAALNTLRVRGMQSMKVKTLELSQSYIMFYDKLERSNYFLETILDNLDEDINSRLMMFLLSNPMGDGGQWDMFVNLVEKYGVVPQEVYPESISSSATQIMNVHINEKLREFACTLREEYKNSISLDDLRGSKQEMMETIYRILTIHNGVPPTEFCWSYRDKDDKFHQEEKAITPRAFLDKYIDINFDDYISLINCPTKDKPFNQHYTVSHLGNVVGGHAVSYVNVDIDVLKSATLETLRGGEAVWFGCDVGKYLSKDKGVLDLDAFQFDLLYHTDFNMDKAARVNYGHSRMGHAMLLTGAHEEASYNTNDKASDKRNAGGRKVTRWKVENSWGKDSGQDGFLVMGDTWFDEYLFQVVLPKDMVSAEVLAVLEQDPVVLPPWDPMGALA